MEIEKWLENTSTSWFLSPFKSYPLSLHDRSVSLFDGVQTIYSTHRWNSYREVVM